MPVIRNHYVIAVHDLDRSRDWYERVLGCETEVVDEGSWLFLSLGACVIMCGRCADAIDPHDLGDHQYFAYLVVDDVDVWHVRALREGAEITKPISDERWGMREFGVRTIDGHRIMIAQRR
jgi:catechol 2,3-dioxygenase-like lactoylglutathione lyase family enzyme